MRVSFSFCYAFMLGNYVWMYVQVLGHSCTEFHEPIKCIELMAMCFLFYCFITFCKLQCFSATSMIIIIIILSLLCIYQAPVIVSEGLILSPYLLTVSGDARTHTLHIKRRTLLKPIDHSVLCLLCKVLLSFK